MYRQSFQMKTYTRVDLVPRMTIILIRSLMTLSSAFVSDKVCDNGEQWPPLHLCGVTRQLSAAAKKQWVRSMQLCRQHTTPWAESRGHHVNLRHNADLDAQDRAWRVLLTYLKFTLLSCPQCWVHTVNLYFTHYIFQFWNSIWFMFWFSLENFQVSEANPIPYFSIHIKYLALTQGLFKVFLIILFSGSSHGFLKKS